MKGSRVLVVDAAINLILGILLILLIPFPEQIGQLLGVPNVEHAFYPSIMGGVFIGIAIALLIESLRNEPRRLVGLGLGGAIAINLCGGMVLAAWLIFGHLDLPLHGQIFLWLIAVTLVAISSIEMIAHLRKNSER